MTPNDAPLQQALSFLPHGAEFRFLDRLIRLDPGRGGEGEYRVRCDEVVLRGHFPGNPMFPGVLLIEAAAQLAGVVAQSDPAIQPLRGLKLTAVRRVRILGSARPGEVIKLEAKVSGRMAHLVQASVAAFVGERTVMQGELTLSGEAQNPSN